MHDITKAAEVALIGGDLSKLSGEERLSYYKNLCESLGLNSLSNPFAYLRLGGRLVLYARKDCTDQLRKIHGVSIEITEQLVESGMAIVRARATDKSGRTDEDTGIVTVGGLKGESLANALMRCVTKAKRRVTLSICGLSMLDESELDTVEQAIVEPIDQRQKAEPMVLEAPQADVAPHQKQKRAPRNRKAPDRERLDADVSALI